MGVSPYVAAKLRAKWYFEIPRDAGELIQVERRAVTAVDVIARSAQTAARSPVPQAGAGLLSLSQGMTFDSGRFCRRRRP